MSVDEINEETYEYGNWSVLKRPFDSRRKVIKTHRARKFFHVRHHKPIVTYRAPLENLISFYIYQRARGLVAATVKIVAFEEEVRFLQGHMEFYSKWEGEMIFFDDLKKSDILAERLANIFPEVAKQSIIDAIQHFDIKKMRNKQAESLSFKEKFASGFTFAGDSKFKNEIKNMITDSELATLADKNRKVHGK